MALRGIGRVKLIVFFALAMLVHGPLSPFLPTAFEATLLYYARLYPAWLLALVGTLGASVAEAVNYRLVNWAAELPKLARLAEGRGVRWSVAAFLRAPFWTTVIVIFSPIPDSAVRVLAPLSQYPLPKFLGAVALGRFPRLLLIAGLGVLVPVPSWLLLGGGIALLALALGRRHVASGFRWLWKRYGDLYAVSVAGFRL
jgi:membrane protein YqaA with SNARE-associated domain